MNKIGNYTSDRAARALEKAFRTGDLTYLSDLNAEEMDAARMLIEMDSDEHDD